MPLKTVRACVRARSRVCRVVKTRENGIERDDFSTGRNEKRNNQSYLFYEYSRIIIWFIKPTFSKPLEIKRLKKKKPRKIKKKSLKRI